MAHSGEIPAQAGLAAVTRRLVLVIAPLWLLPVVATMATTGSDWSRATLAVAMFAAGAGLVRFARSGDVRAALAGLALAVLWLALHDPLSMPGAAPDLNLEQWLNLAAWCTGLLVAHARRASAWVLLVVAATVLIVAVRHLAVALPLPLDALAAMAAYGLTDGLAAVVAFRALRRAAARADQLAVEQAAASRSAARAAAREREARLLARQLHDTVVNTLGVVRRSLGVDAAQVRTRAALDLLALRSDGEPAVTAVSDLMSPLRAHADRLGLHVEVSSPAALAELSTTVAEALLGAGRELLNNVATHAGTREARLSLQRQADAVVLEVADAGCGFEPANTPLRGSRESVLRRCSDAGITVQVDSRPGQGTRVRLVAPTGLGAGPTPPLVPALDADLAEAVWGLGAVLAGLGAVATLRLALGPEHDGAGVVALLLVVPLLWATRRTRVDAVVRRLPWPLYMVLAAAAVALPSWGVEGCMRVQAWWWGPFAGILVAAYVTILDGRRRALAAMLAGTWSGYALAIASLTNAAAACAQDTVAFAVLHTGIVVGLRAARRLHERLWLQGHREAVALAAVRLAAAETDAAARVRASVRAAANALAGPVLQGLADGSLDPALEEVRTRAGQAEEALRALTAVPPQAAAEMSAIVTEAVRLADDAGVRLLLDLAAAKQPRPDQLPAIRALLRSVLAETAPGSDLRVTALADSEQALRLLLLVLPRELDAAAARLAAAGWSVEAVGEQLLLDTRWEGA